jgi:hypothetical protein
LALLRRDENSIRYYSLPDSMTWDTLLEDDKYTTALVSWPRGLQVLRTSGSFELTSKALDLLWRAAEILDNSLSMEVLLHYSVPLRREHWYRACNTSFRKGHWKLEEATEIARR